MACKTWEEHEDNIQGEAASTHLTFQRDIYARLHPLVRWRIDFMDKGMKKIKMVRKKKKILRRHPNLDAINLGLISDSSWNDVVIHPRKYYKPGVEISR